jgi:3-oxoacyl-[acyl-carrier protein] reductase
MVGDPQLYELGQRVTSGGGAPIDQAAALAVFLASEASGTLSGRLISAVTDDFPNLPAQIPRIMASDALTLRRVDWR